VCVCVCVCELYLAYPYNRQRGSTRLYVKQSCSASDALFALFVPSSLSGLVHFSFQSKGIRWLLQCQYWRLSGALRALLFTPLVVFFFPSLQTMQTQYSKQLNTFAGRFICQIK